MENPLFPLPNIFTYKKIAIIPSFFALFLLLAVRACGVEIIDLGADDPPEVPIVVEYPGTPLYITNSDTTAAEAEVDSLRVAKGARLHLGYTHEQTGVGDVTLNVLNDTTIEGEAKLGKLAGGGSGLPDAATSQNIDLNISGNLTIAGGTLAALAGTITGGIGISVSGDLNVTKGGVYLQGSEDLGHVTLSAASVTIADGSLALGSYATLTTPISAVESDEPSLRIAKGGVLELGGGTPPWDPAEIWEFRGVNLAGGGAGLVVERGGVLRTATAGGYIQGGLTESLRIAEGGALDTGEGRLVAYQFDDIHLGGSYRAGYNNFTASTNHLDAYTSPVTIATTARLGMTRDLQRAINDAASLDIDNAAILRGGDIIFESGVVPTMQTGMGEYYLAVGQNPSDDRTSLWIEKVVGGVLGDGTTGDRDQFHHNMERLWQPGRMSSAQSNNIYNLTAAEVPTVYATNDAGGLNQEILEAFVDGRDMPVGDGKIADAGLFEMYNGSPSFGVNSVAYNTATEVLATIGNRLNEMENELASASGSSNGAFAFFCGAPEYRENRFWVGGFGRQEEADLDYGISGYKYKPSGVALGYDRVFGSLALGGALTYGRGNYEDKAADRNDSKITSYSVSAYGAYYHWSGFKAAAYGTYSHLNNDIRDDRGGFRRSADHDSYAWSLGAKLGYDMRPADRLTVSPSIGITKIRAVNKEHGEYLDGQGVIRLGEIRRDSTLMPLDLSLAFDLYRGQATLFRLTTNLGYAYDFDDGGIFGDIYYEGLEGATAMPVAKRESGRHRFNFGAGVVWSGSRLDMSAKYDYYRRADQDAHQVRGNLGVKF